MKKYNLTVVFTMVYALTLRTVLNAMDDFIPSVPVIGNLTAKVQERIKKDVLQFFQNIDCSHCKDQTQINTTLATTWGHSKHKPASYQSEINSSAFNEESSDVFSALDTMLQKTLHVAVEQKCKERGIKYIKD